MYVVKWTKPDIGELVHTVRAIRIINNDMFLSQFQILCIQSFRYYQNIFLLIHKQFLCKFSIRLETMDKVATKYQLNKHKQGRVKRFGP